MVTFHRIDNDIYGFIKGAPNILIPLCQLDETKQQALIKINQNYASKGLRVLAVASVCLSVDEFDENANLSDYIHHLTFQGLIGLIDPLRKEAQKAIKLCHQAGIAVKMITGDQAPTATAIAHQLSLPGEVLTSQAVDQLSDADLVEKIDDISVFARATPEQKVRIVNALKKRGHVTAMTGDGVNDAPALKSADIGVAMGLNGTDVTKEAATVILTDDNFATIVHAVKEGRTIFDNIIKFVRFQLSTNIGAIITVVFAPFFGVAFPFTPIQLLWVNIIMDGPPAMALGLDPSRPQIMQIPPRSTNVRILNFHRLGNIMLYGITMAVGTLSVLLWAQQHYVEQVALTMSFTTFVLFQVFNVFNARSDLGTAFNRDFFKNIYLWLALAIVVMVQVIVVHWSFMQEIFKTADLSVNQWLITVVVASSVLVLDECRKLLQGIFKV